MHQTEAGLYGRCCDTLCFLAYEEKEKWVSEINLPEEHAKSLLVFLMTALTECSTPPTKYRGLSLMKASWEAYVQHINICNTLLRVDDCHLHIVRDLVSEKDSALSKLNITTIDAINRSGRKIRKHVRNEAFQTWTNHTLRGKGVIVYSDLPKANSRKEEKKLVGSLVEKKLPSEGCTGRNGEREKSSGQKKISDDRRHKHYGSCKETKRKAENRKD
ncbi:hypothetical protein ANN_03596 [Periplaneta americana]|uniref:Uncharacterized protein n=1 Tax=Periplaneta americana TaxID=6978 RepID=A0ABQ8TZG1_PERAM|nr:hypothetical protein ANN_03596 [Periplaneta americana]